MEKVSGQKNTLGRGGGGHMMLKVSVVKKKILSCSTLLDSFWAFDFEEIELER